jgi:hypothetical protein
MCARLAIESSRPRARISFSGDREGRKLSGARVSCACPRLSDDARDGLLVVCSVQCALPRLLLLYKLI